MLRYSVGATARLCGRSISGSQSESPASSFVRGVRNNSFVASRRAAAGNRGVAAALRSKNPIAGVPTPARSILKSLERNSSATAAAQPAAKGVPFSELTVGVPKEIFDNEKRVALSPAAAATLIKSGFKINVEAGAGFEAKFLDAEYVAAGCNIVDSASAAFGSDIVLKVRPPSMEEVPLVKDGGHLISFVYPAQNKDLLDALAEKKATVLGMECVPRISRAQVREPLVCFNPLSLRLYFPRQSRAKHEFVSYVRASGHMHIFAFHLHVHIPLGIRRSFLHGKYRWLQSRGRSRFSLRPLLHGSNHGRG